VAHVELLEKLPGILSRGRHGHALVVPHFGTIHLAEILVEHGRKSLTMLRVELGSPVEGRLLVGTAEAGGTSQPFTESELQSASPRPIEEELLRASSPGRLEVEAELVQQSKSRVRPTDRPPRYTNAALFDPANTHERGVKIPCPGSFVLKYSRSSKLSLSPILRFVVSWRKNDLNRLAILLHGASFEHVVKVQLWPTNGRRWFVSIVLIAFIWSHRGGGDRIHRPSSSL